MHHKNLTHFLMCMAVAFVLVLGLACHGVSSKNQQPSEDNAEQPVRQ